MSPPLSASIALFACLVHPLAAATDRPAGCACLPGGPAAGPLVLDEATQAALRFQIDEERMARELYEEFGRLWGLRPFHRIPAAEARHEAALRALAGRAGMTLPAAPAGRFATAEVQRRHDALLARGRQSGEAALRAAALVEEQDIADLRALAATAGHPELKRVVAALEGASGNHLAAFVRQLRTRGEAYQPEVLDPGDEAVRRAGGKSGSGCGRRHGPAV